MDAKRNNKIIEGSVPVPVGNYVAPSFGNSQLEKVMEQSRGVAPMDPLLMLLENQPATQPAWKQGRLVASVNNEFARRPRNIVHRDNVQRFRKGCRCSPGAALGADCDNVRGTASRELQLPKFRISWNEWCCSLRSFLLVVVVFENKRGAPVAASVPRPAVP